MPKGFAEDYIQVNERILAFKEQFPDGSLQSEVVTFTDNFVMVKAYAYRTPDDERPGIGHSGLKIPGKTPFTVGSELENAETSAWGRALAALGFEVKRGIASAEEVAMKRDGDITISIEGSEIVGIERGGRTTYANKLQVQAVSELSLQLKLGPPGMKSAIEAALGDDLILPDDDKEAAKVIASYLNDLGREEIGMLIGYMTSQVQE